MSTVRSAAEEPMVKVCAARTQYAQARCETEVIYGHNYTLHAKNLAGTQPE